MVADERGVAAGPPPRKVDMMVVRKDTYQQKDYMYPFETIPQSDGMC